MRVTLLLLLALFAIFGQAAEDRAAKVEFTKNALEGTRALGEFVQDKFIQQQIDKFIDENYKDMLSALEWNGRAEILIDVSLQSNGIGSERQLGSPVILGSGDTPEQIMLNAMAAPALRPAPDSNFSYSTEKSHLILIKYKKGSFFSKPSLERGVIPAEGRKIIARRVAEKLNDQNFVHAQRQAAAVNIYANVAEHYRSVATDAEKARRLAERAQAIRDNLQKLDVIQTRLKTALDEEARVNRLADSFRLLGTVMSYAQMSLQFESALELKPKATTSEGLLKETDEYKSKTKAAVAELQSLKSDARSQLQQDVKEIRQTAIQEGASSITFPPVLMY